MPRVWFCIHVHAVLVSSIAGSFENSVSRRLIILRQTRLGKALAQTLGAGTARHGARQFRNSFAFSEFCCNLIPTHGRCNFVVYFVWDNCREIHDRTCERSIAFRNEVL